MRGFRGEPVARLARRHLWIACGVAVALTAGTAIPATADDGTAAAGPVECAAPSLTATNVAPTTSVSRWNLKAPKKTGLPAPTDALSPELRQALNASLRYNLTVWFPTCYGGQTGPVVPNGVGEVPVRAPATVAYATAIALKTRAYDPAAVGVPANVATQIAKRLVVGLALTQRVNAGPTGWGHNWQSSYWAFLAGTAGWLLFPNMSMPERQAVARMVVNEADYQVKKPAASRIGYYSDQLGNTISPGNTRAEDDAWNATILGLAVAMLPNLTRAPGWRRLEANDQIAAYSRPVDLTIKHRTVNGHEVRAWLKGSNIFNDGTLVNHNVINPGYMAQSILNLDGALTAGITGKPGLSTAKWNAAHVYQALSTVSFTPPPFRAPGGTIYTPNSGYVYYPQGEATWGTTRVTQFLAFDTIAANAGFGVQFGAPGWMTLHLNRQLELQSRFTDGRTFAGQSADANAEYTYLGREQVTAGELAEAWLAQYLGSHSLLTFTNDKV